MNLKDLQDLLKCSGRYAGAVDGLWGRLTEAAILLAMTDGPDTALTESDYVEAAERQRIPVAYVKAFASVEAAGAGFFQGRPLILPEPHRFSRATGGRFDAKFPSVSYPSWGQRPYPKTQDARYDLLLRMIRLDVDAGFGSASYGKFQIMGENHDLCGYPNAFRFAEAMARDERTHLMAFERFCEVTGVAKSLRAQDWDAAFRRYNGTAYRKNRYKERFLEAVRRFER
jgi:hypothetical protein